jgi:hypothetical protein
VANRSQSQRLFRPSRLALLCAALLLPHAAGCQSNAQQDLVARELRMQEDQIYAMEDYLTQYQQLICKYRSENAALRRQLAGGDEKDGALPAPGGSLRSRNGKAPADDALEIDVSPQPRINGAPPPSELEVPDVPPLGETTFNDHELEHQFFTSDGTAASAAEEPRREAFDAAQAVAYETKADAQPIYDVWLRGEVIANGSGEGPRLAIDVVPLDSAGQPTEFAGPLSLMLLASQADEGPQSLARWDFSPEEVQAAIQAADAERPIRFFVELPPDTPLATPTELWARLLPHGGPKLLAHVPIDLVTPGLFSSLPQMAAPPEIDEEQPIIAAAFADVVSPSTPSTVPVSDAGWAIAKPGEPANLAENNSESASEWRVSSEPMPVVAAHSTPARRLRTIPAPTPPKGERPEPIVDARIPAGWSPERPAESRPEPARAATHASLPRWSATR